MPKHGKALIETDGNICPVEKAYQRYFKAFGEKEPGGKQKKLKKNLEKKARKWWDNTNAYLEDEAAGDIVQHKEKQAAYQAWEERKRAHEALPKNRDTYWQYDKLQDAVSALKTDGEN